MYKISVPVINNRISCENGGRELVLSELRRVGAERVFLAIGTHILNRDDRRREFSILKENSDFFKSHGFETGAWLWSFLANGEAGFTHIRGASGETSDASCPSDPNFVCFMRQYVADIARCGVDMIMLDDDFRFGHMTDDLACTCELHMKRITELLGEDITPDVLKEKVTNGAGNRYRDAWLKANGESLSAFAEALREAVDGVNPSVRMGQCSCMSSWGADGVLPETIAAKLAGKTRPFFRLIGAPYWAVNRLFDDNRLQNVIEFERMQKSFCRTDAEIFAEGDTYPRPRHYCPASYLEIFDTAMRADGETDGILKYVIDYWAKASYETGYIDRHVKNRAAYEWIEKNVSHKTAVGVRIYESPEKLRTMRLSPKAREGGAIYKTVFSQAAKLLADCSIPTTYHGEGICSAAFDENIKYVPEKAWKNGIFLDMRAADILSERGIDTGIIEKGERVHSENEHFSSGETLYIPDGIDAYRLKLNENCEVLSSFSVGNNEKIPAVFLYRNSAGHIFTIFNFDAYFGNPAIYRSYARSEQLAYAVKRMTGKNLPAYAYGNPDFYIMAKRDSEGTAVCLWNIFADTAEKPIIELDAEYENAEFFGCDGTICRNRVFLSDIAPFSFAGFTVK